MSPFVELDDSRGATTTVEDFSGPQQPQQQQHSFAGAEDVAERLAGGERLKSTTGNSSAGVFYNRVGAISRDLSVLMANVLAEERMAASGRTRKTKNAVEATTAASLGEDSSGARTNAGDGTERNGLVVLDAFAASGVRALRYGRRSTYTMAFRVFGGQNPFQLCTSNDVGSHAFLFCITIDQPWGFRGLAARAGSVVLCDTSRGASKGKGTKGRTN